MAKNNLPGLSMTELVRQKAAAQRARRQSPSFGTTTADNYRIPAKEQRASAQSNVRAFVSQKAAEQRQRRLEQEQKEYEKQLNWFNDPRRAAAVESELRKLNTQMSQPVSSGGAAPVQLPGMADARARLTQTKYLYDTAHGKSPQTSVPQSDPLTPEQQRRAETEKKVAAARQTLANGFDYNELTVRRDNLAWQLENLSPRLSPFEREQQTAALRSQIGELDTVLESIREAKRTVSDYEGSQQGREARAAELEQQAWNDPEFSALAAQGLEMENNLGLAFGQTNTDTVAGNLNADELLTYSYLLAKNGTTTANEYLDSIVDRASSRVGAAQAEQILGIDNPLLRAAAIGGQGIVTGLNQFGTGASQMFTNAQLPTTPTQHASSAISEELGTVGKVAYDLITTTANMAPSILLSAVSGGLGASAGVASAIGAGALGMSSSGNAYNQALAEGRSINEARSYSLLVGAAEASTQYLLGGISKLGGKVSGNMLAKKIASLDSAFKRAAAKLGVSMASEGIEESLQTYLEPLFASIIFDESYDAPEFGEVAYSFLLGVLSAGVMEGGDLLASQSNTDRANGREILLDGEAVDGIIAAGRESDPSGAAYRLAGRLSTLKEKGKTKKLTATQLGRLTRLLADETAATARKAAATAAIPASAPEIRPAFDTASGRVTLPEQQPSGAASGETIQPNGSAVTDYIALPTAQEQLDRVREQGGGYLPNAYDAGTTKEFRDALNTLGKTFGKVYTFTDSITSASGSEANGAYSSSNGIIVVSRDAAQALPWVIGHETAHMLASMDRTVWAEFRSYAAELVGPEAAEAKIRAGLSDAEAAEEVAADVIGQMLTDEQTLIRFTTELQRSIERGRAKPSLAARLAEAIRRFVAKLRNSGFSQRGAANLQRAGIDLKRAESAAVRLEQLARHAAASFASETVGGSVTRLADAYRSAIAADSTISAGQSEQARAILEANSSTADAPAAESSTAFTEDELAALAAYKSSESYKINAKLRDAPQSLTEQDKAFVRSLDSAIDKLPAYRGKVYRTLTFDSINGRKEMDAFLETHRKGRTVSYPAYTSASARSDGYPIDSGNLVQLIIESKSGKDMSGHGNNMESEVIYPRGFEFSMISINPTPAGGWVLQLREGDSNAREAERETEQGSVRGTHERRVHSGDTGHHSREQGSPADTARPAVRQVQALPRTRGTDDGSVVSGTNAADMGLSGRAGGDAGISRARPRIRRSVEGLQVLRADGITSRGIDRDLSDTELLASGDYVDELEYRLRRGEITREEYDELFSSYIEGDHELNERQKFDEDVMYSLKDNPTALTESDIRAVQSIGRKSVNDFSSEEIAKTEAFARKYWQELGTKSPFFRAWFGDWRAYDTTPVQIADRPGADRGVHRNDDTGWDIQVSRVVFNETNVHRSVGSKTAQPYLACINDIVKKAVLIDSYAIEEGRRKSAGSLMMHSLYAVADAGNGRELIKLYVEEMYDPNRADTAKRAYQLQNIERQQSGVEGSEGTLPSLITRTADIKTIADLYAAVKSKDKNLHPKPLSHAVLNGDGTPKVFYHGTGEKFFAFDPSEIAPREGSFFFAENYEDAAAYGGNVLEVYLSGRNLADYDNQPREFYLLKSKREQVAWLKARGYDGWYADMDSGGWGEVSVFYPEQIKSATDNIGTFDGANPDIRFSLKLVPAAAASIAREAAQAAEATDAEYYSRPINTIAQTELMRLPERLRKRVLTHSHVAARSFAKRVGIPEASIDDVLQHPFEQLCASVMAVGSVTEQECRSLFNDVFAKLSGGYGENAELYRATAYASWKDAVGKLSHELLLEKRYEEHRHTAEEAKTARRAEQAAMSPKTPDEALTLGEEVAELRRGMERAQHRARLIEEDKSLVSRLMRGEIEPSCGEVQGSVNRSNILKVYEARKAWDKKNKVLERYRRELRDARRADIRQHLSGIADYTDKKAGIFYSTETMARNILDVVPKSCASDRNYLTKLLVTNVQKANAAATRLKDEYRERIAKLGLSREVESSNAVSESAAVQQLGEALDSIRILERSKGRMKDHEGRTLEQWHTVVNELKANNPAMNWAKIEASVGEFRAVYDELLERMNRVLVENGYPPVPHRSGYFPHLHDPDRGDGVIGAIGALAGITTEVTALPTDINGLTHMFKPGKTWFAHAQQRTSFDTTYDAVLGFDRYIEGVADVIFHTDNIQNARALSQELRYLASPEGIRRQEDAVMADESLSDADRKERLEALHRDGRTHLSNFVVYLDRWANHLANKKSNGDREMEYEFTRKAYNVVNGLFNRYGSSVIGFNVASAASNLVTLPNALADIPMKYLAGAFTDSIRNIKMTDSFSCRSAFLTNRKGSDTLVDRSLQDLHGNAVVAGLQKAGAKLSDASFVMMDLTDSLTSELVVRARYRQNLDRGMSEAAALDEADSFAASLFAERAKGSMPIIFEQRNPVTRAFTQFQLEVNNQFRFAFKDLPRLAGEQAAAKLAWRYIKLALAIWLFNDLFEKLFGRDVAPDIIGLISETLGDFFGYELENVIDFAWEAVAKGDISPIERVEAQDDRANAVINLVSNVVSEVPFIGGVLGNGGRVPISSIFPDGEGVIKMIFSGWGNVDEGEDGESSGWSAARRKAELKDLLISGAALLVPGGNSIKKAVLGITTAYQRGSYYTDTDGNRLLQYPIHRDNVWEDIGAFFKGIVGGKSSHGTAQEWVDSGFSGYSAKQTTAYIAMLAAGTDGKDAIALLDRLESINNDDTLEGTGVKAAAKHQAIRDAGLSDEARFAAYYSTLAKNTKDYTLLAELAAMGEDPGRIVDFAMDYSDLSVEDATGDTKKAVLQRERLLEAGFSDRALTHIYYEKVLTANSEEERELMDALELDGANMGKVTRALIGIAIGDSSSAKRTAILESGLSDDIKGMLYVEKLYATDDELKARERLDAFLEVGLTVDDLLRIHNKETEIGSTEGTSAAEQRDAFDRWLREQGYTAGQRDTVHEHMGFWSHFKAK